MKSTFLKIPTFLFAILFASCGGKSSENSSSTSGKNGSLFSSETIVSESEIISNFSGFSSDNVFILANGEVWKQTDYKTDYSYKTRPDVKILKDGIYFKMKVEDMEDPIKVEKLEVRQESEIVSDFSGFSSGNVFELSNGDLWEQEDYTTEYSYKTRPDIKIVKDGSDDKLYVEGMKKLVKIKKLDIITKSSISSEFKGFQMGNVYKLSNGQNWEQWDATIQISIKIMPRVVIFSSSGTYKMKVEGIEKVVSVRRK